MLTSDFEHWNGLSDVSTGSEPGFYQWSRGVCLQANLDLILDWAQSNGLGEVAGEHMHTLSSAVSLLATPRMNLLQVRQRSVSPGAHLIWMSGVMLFPCAQRSWVSLRSDYPALSPAQLNHLLSLYSPSPPCRHSWTPSVHEQASTSSTGQSISESWVHWFVWKWFSFHCASSSLSWHSGELWNAASTGALGWWLPVPAGKGSDWFCSVGGAGQAYKVHFHSFPVWWGYNNWGGKGTDGEKKFSL